MSAPGPRWTPRPPVFSGRPIKAYSDAECSASRWITTEIGGAAAFDAMFAPAVTFGCEGLVCKSAGPDSAYQEAAELTMI
jgi:ATP-dependent DNA ligase